MILCFAHDVFVLASKPHPLLSPIYGRLRVHGDLCANQMSRLTPVVEENTLFERLAAGRNYDDVMLAIGVDKRLGPVELERLQLQRIQSNEKLRCPLKTESPFSRSHID